jgi:adenylate kinase family enzyme
MNIVEAYIKLKGRLVILISGMSGSGKSKVAKEISRDFKIENINANKFCRNDYNVKVPLPFVSNVDNAVPKRANVGDEIINWDTDDIYDWDSLNKEIVDRSSKGVVVSAIFFPKDKLKAEFDFHLHIKLGKQNLFKRRVEYLDEHNEDCRKQDRNLDKDVELAIFNKYTFPYYMEQPQRTATITKFINANEFMTDASGTMRRVDDIEKTYHDKLYDDAFDYLMSQIQKYLANRNKAGEETTTHKYDRGFESSKNITKRKPDFFAKEEIDEADIASTTESEDDLDTTDDNLSETGYPI